MYTVIEALQELQAKGITDSIQMVRRWLREGVIQGERSGDRKTGWQIHPDELARFIAARHPGEKLRLLEAEIDRLTDEIERLRKERHVAGRHPTESAPLYGARDVDECWNMRLHDYKDVPDEILQEARHSLNRGLLEMKTATQYICPFTGKRFGRCDNLIRAAIPYVIEATIAQHKRKEERRDREREKRPLYFAQL